jgi:hypothetical protein
MAEPFSPEPAPSFAVALLGAGALSVLFALLLAAAISEVTTGANAVKAAAAAVIAISFLI